MKMIKCIAVSIIFSLIVQPLTISWAAPPESRRRTVTGAARTVSETENAVLKSKRVVQRQQELAQTQQQVNTRVRRTRSTAAAVQTTTQAAVQTTSAAVQQTSAVVNQAATRVVSQSAATTAPVYQDAQGNNIYRPTYSGSALLATPVTPVAGDGNVPSYATAATATTLPAWTYEGHTLLNFSGRQGYDLGGTFVTLGEPGIPDMNLYDQQGRDMLGDQTLTRAQIEQRIAGLQKAFPNFTSGQYKIMMEADPNIWQSAPNSKIPEALIEPLAQAGSTIFSGNFDAGSLRQLKALDVDKTRGELRYYNQYGTKPKYASILNGVVNSAGLLWDQRRQAFRQFNSGDSVGQNWAYGVYDPLPAFDSRNDYGQLYLSMSDVEYNKAIGGSQGAEPAVTSSSNQVAAATTTTNQVAAQTTQTTVNPAPVYQDAQGNYIYRATSSRSALLSTPVTPVAGDGNVPSYATAATATTLPAWTYEGHTLLNFSGGQGYDLGGTFITLGEPGYPDMNLYDQQGRDMLGDQTLTRAQIQERIAGLQKAFPNFSAAQYKIMMEADPNIWKNAANGKIPEALIEPLAQGANMIISGNFSDDDLRQLKALDVDRTRGELRYYNQYGTKPKYASILNYIVTSPGLLWDQTRQAFRQFNAGDSVGRRWAYGVYDPLPASDSNNQTANVAAAVDTPQSPQIQGVQDISIYGQPMYRGTGRDWSQVLAAATQAGEVWSYNDYAHYFYNPRTNSVRVIERQGYSDQPTHEQLLSWVPPSGAIDYVRMHQAIQASELQQQLTARYHNDVASGRFSQNGLFFDNDMQPSV